MVLEKECEERRKNQSEHEVEIKVIKRERNQQMDSLARIMIDNERLKVSLSKIPSYFTHLNTLSPTIKLRISTAKLRVRL
jgi:hypothetical protein